MTAVKVKKNYQNVTKKWLDSATPNSHRIKDREYFEDEKGKKYYVDEKKVVLDYSKKEKEIALWLEETFGGELYMIPRVNNPEGISTPDYLFRGNKFDLKGIIGTSKTVLDNAINRKKKQSPNFIFDIQGKFDMEALEKQIDSIYYNPHRDWVNTIVIRKSSRLVAVYKKEIDYPSK